MTKSLTRIMTFLSERFGIDFSVRQNTILMEKIQGRLKSLDFDDPDVYLDHLHANEDEVKRLLASLTINASSFFRSPLTFEYLNQKTLPAIIAAKCKTGIRVWSAGCAMGEEAYSIAILLNDLFKKKEIFPEIHIFATDLSPQILEKAAKGIYRLDQVKNVKFGILSTYFERQGNSFHLSDRIKKMVSFSVYDMMDSRTYVPPDSIFGNFDLILCRNLLIYFSIDKQKKIFSKLYKATGPNGTLVIGDSEAVPDEYMHQLVQDTPYCRIYRKPGSYQS